MISVKCLQVTQASAWQAELNNTFDNRQPIWSSASGRSGGNLRKRRKFELWFQNDQNHSIWGSPFAFEAWQKRAFQKPIMSIENHIKTWSFSCIYQETMDIAKTICLFIRYLHIFYIIHILTHIHESTINIYKYTLQNMSHFGTIAFRLIRSISCLCKAWGGQ